MWPTRAVIPVSAAGVWAAAVPGARHPGQDVATPGFLSAQGVSARSGAAGVLSRAWGAAGDGAVGTAGFGIHDVVRGVSSDLRQGDADESGRRDGTRA